MSMIAEHPLFPRFPDAVVPESAHSFEWRGNQRSTSSAADARIVRSSRPYWYSNLSGCLCNERQKDEILAIQWRQRGMTIPVLMRVSPFSEIGTILGYDHWDNAIVEPAYLGLGDGTEKQLQIKKRLLVPGYEDEFEYYEVTKPHIDYPAQYSIGETAYGPIEYRPMAELTVYVGNVEIPYGDGWVVDKDTGIITQSLNGEIYVSGGFYIPMLLPPAIEFKKKGGLWEIANNVRLEEPPGSGFIPTLDEDEDGAGGGDDGEGGDPS